MDSLKEVQALDTIEIFLLYSACPTDLNSSYSPKKDNSSTMSQSSAETTVARGVQVNNVEVEEPSVLTLTAITKGQGFTFDTDVHNSYRLGGNAKDVVSRREASHIRFCFLTFT